MLRYGGRRVAKPPKPAPRSECSSPTKLNRWTEAFGVFRSTIIPAARPVFQCIRDKLEQGAVGLGFQTDFG